MKIKYQNRVWPIKSYHLWDFTFSPHLHNQIEVVYIIRGNCTMMIEHTTYEVEQGDFIVILPYQLHNFSQSRDCEMLVQVFDPDFAPDMVPKLEKSQLKECVIKGMPSDCIEALMKAEYYYEQETDLRIVRSYVGVYMSFLYGSLEFVDMDNTDYHSVLYELLLYIDAHFTEHLSLELLADRFHITRFYISRLFSKKLNMSFNDYVNQLRIDYAVELLCQSDMPISEVGEASGFECERSFYRVFKQHTGMTPLQKRREGDNRNAESDLMDRYIYSE